MRPGQIREIKATMVPSDKTNRTPLHYAAYGTDNAEMLQGLSLLLQKGANPSQQDTEGLTVHHLAVIHDLKKMVQFLARYGGISIRDKHWRTPVCKHQCPHPVFKSTP